MGIGLVTTGRGSSSPIKHKEMKIETIEIAGLAGALNALRLPFGKEVRSDIKVEIGGHPATFGSSASIIIDSRDLQLMSTLVKRGDEHAKVVRGIMVWVKITAPVYWWCEEETYRAGHERLASNSTMHQDCRGLSGADLVAAKAAIPMGKELTKVDMFSYQALRNIVRQRHDHRLPEWHEFVDWVKSLPFADDLILAGLSLEEQPGRWRAEEGGEYYTLYRGKVMKTTDRRKAFDNRAWNSGVYYQTKEEAKAKAKEEE